MSASRANAAAAVCALAVIAVASGGVVFAVQDDPRELVAPVNVGKLELPLPVEAASSGEGAQQVAALDKLTGTLNNRGGEADEFSIGAVDLDFGPDDWVRSAGPQQDYDGDGDRENLLAELEGLIGQPVTILVRLDSDGDDADVYVINALPYRDSAGAAPPWQLTGEPAAAIASPEQVTAAAARAVGPGANVTELERDNEANRAWEAEVIDANGREHSVLLDSAGRVLEVELDD